MLYFKNLQTECISVYTDKLENGFIGTYCQLSTKEWYVSYSTRFSPVGKQSCYTYSSRRSMFRGMIKRERRLCASK